MSASFAADSTLDNTDSLDDSVYIDDPGTDPSESSDGYVEDPYVDPVDNVESYPIDETSEDPIEDNQNIDDSGIYPEDGFTGEDIYPVDDPELYPTDGILEDPIEDNSNDGTEIYPEDIYPVDDPVSDDMEYPVDYYDDQVGIDENGEPKYYIMPDLIMDPVGDGTDYVNNPVYLPDMLYTQDDETLKDIQLDDSINDPKMYANEITDEIQDPATNEEINDNEAMYALENKDNQGSSKEVQAVSSNSVKSSVNAADKSIPMQKTGSPIIPLIIGSLMVLGGLILPKRM